MNSLPKTVTRQRRSCVLNPGLTATESSTLASRLPSHPASNNQIPVGLTVLIYPLWYHLELFLDNFPQVVHIGGDVAHGTVDAGNVRGVDVFVSGAEMNPDVPCNVDVTAGTK